MNSFISFSAEIQTLLKIVIKSDELHSKWLNTLSFLENCGARKIAACEHPTLVKEDMLKHAAEEFRHAHYLKKQIKKMTVKQMETYSLSNILGGQASLHYLPALDLQTSRFLNVQGLSKNLVKEFSYLLVTYAIERRADELYTIYDRILREHKSKVVVKSILLEEENHLNEMILGLNQIPNGNLYAQSICQYESQLCDKWLKALMCDVIKT